MAVFRARARAVDMLGRQQIAGIPTAISELFKNAHDAYAAHVVVDFYRTDGLFVLRDDGVGMSLEEFEARWLTLGTESKVAARSGLRPPPVDPSKPSRPILGEKGVGRLAIAAIGPQVLILTRSKASSNAPLVGAFINWGMFRLPGVDLEQIVIPVREFSGGLPTAKEVKAMVAEVRKNLTHLARFADADVEKEIGAQLDGFDVDPRKLATFLADPSLLDGGHGTHFYIQPSDESIAPAIDGRGDADDVAPPLLKALVGFTNSMTPRHTPPVIEAAFRDHRTEDVADDIIGESEFFAPSEFREADHHIEGQFDEFGQFAGTITVYGEATVGHVVPWSAGGAPTACGPFRINLAVVQGNARDSTMPQEDWARIVRKLNRYGGLYIYRDGIRVLPYGNNDYDFLDIERNRTKSASYYYFSYRRIFGIVEIDRARNNALQEKAGREGFRENKAYRQFREILKNFFVQIAADFFRDGGTNAGRFVDRRSELDRVERARREREKLVSVRRSAFRERLDNAFVSLAEGAPATEVSSMLESARRDAKIAASMRDRSQSAAALIDLESSIRTRLVEARERYRVVPPRGVGLPLAVRRDYDAYRDEFERVEQLVFIPASLEVEKVLAEAASGARLTIDRRLRFERFLNELSSQIRKSSQEVGNDVRVSVEEVQSRASALVRERVAAVETVVRDVMSRAARIDVARLADNAFVDVRRGLESEIEQAGEREQRALSSVLEQIRAIVWPTDGNAEPAITSVEMNEAADEELLALRERSESDLELAQLGMAIQVVNHEFDATIKSVRRSLRELKTWADANEDLEAVYGNIRRSFDHLDGYLTLFTPLQRRLYRKPVRMSGAEVFKFLQDLFADRFLRHDVILEATSRFKRNAFRGFPSTFYPVFVNLVDNAIFWLRQSSKPRIVRLDMYDGVMIVANSGPPISVRDRDVIFELGFTRKPGGRGLGLHISRQVLRKEGFDLDLIPAPEGLSVAFGIDSASGQTARRDSSRDGED